MLNRRRRSNEQSTSQESSAPRQESAAEAPGTAQNAGGAPRGRASWTGLLQLSLVVVPVKAYPAVSTTESFHFNQLHAGCGERIRYQKHCPVHGEVNTESIVHGYQYTPGQYVLVEPSELEKLRPPKERGLVLEQFVDAERIEPVLFSGRSLYLFPEGFPKGFWGQGKSSSQRWSPKATRASWPSTWAVATCPGGGCRLGGRSSPAFRSPA